MVNQSDVNKVLDEIEFLFEKYSNEMRATTQPYYLARLKAKNNDHIYDPTDALVRESLLEHVGSLPMMAIAIYPYLNDPTVDLGDALVMLSIHDIGELITGDEMTFTKKSDGKSAEKAAALSLLHHSYHDIYEEVESQTSSTAQFAKAIDKFAPDFFDYVTPADVTTARYKHFVGIEVDAIVGLIDEHKTPFMTWNPFMSELHKGLLARIRNKLS